MPNISIDESRIPRLWRTEWLIGNGARLRGLNGLGATQTFTMDIWQLQNWLKGAGFAVSTTGRWDNATSQALATVAGECPGCSSGPWDDSYTVAMSTGAVTITPGGKSGVPFATTISAWTNFSQLIASGASRPPATMIAPAAPAAPTDVESISAYDTLVLLRAVGYWPTSLANYRSGEVLWTSAIKAALNTWAAARGKTYQLYVEPDPPIGEPASSYKRIYPSAVWTQLVNEAEAHPVEWQRARIEIGAETGIAPPRTAVVSPVRPTQAAVVPTTSKAVWAWLFLAGTAGLAYVSLVRSPRKRRRR